MDVPDKYEFELHGGRTITLRIPVGKQANEVLTLLDSLAVLAAKAKADGEQGRSTVAAQILDSAPSMLRMLAEGFEGASDDDCRRMAAFIGAFQLLRMLQRCGGVHAGKADLL